MKISKAAAITTSLLLTTLLAMTAQADDDTGADVAADEPTPASEPAQPAATIAAPFDGAAQAPGASAARGAAPLAPETTAATTGSTQPGPRRFHAGVGFVMGTALGDLEDSVDASPGATLGIGYDAHPRLRVFSELRYIPIVQAAPDPALDLEYYDLGVGLRGSFVVGAHARGFIEGRMIRGTVAASNKEGGHNKTSGMGFGARAGLDVSLLRGLSLEPSVAYSNASINPLTVEWLSMELTLALGF